MSELGNSADQVIVSRYNYHLKIKVFLWSENGFMKESAFQNLLCAISQDNLQEKTCKDLQSSFSCPYFIKLSVY